MKSKKYSIGSDEVSFEFDGGNLVGIVKNGSPVDPNSDDFASFKDSDESLEAFNIAVHGEPSVVDSVDTANIEVLDDNYTKATKKKANAEAAASAIGASNQPVAPNAGRESNPRFLQAAKRPQYAPVSPQQLTYPVDMDKDQDYMSIKIHEYKRREVDQSYSSSKKAVDPKGAFKGQICLPMPVVKDSNAAQWGESVISATSIGVMRRTASLGAKGFLGLGGGAGGEISDRDLGGGDGGSGWGWGAVKRDQILNMATKLGGMTVSEFMARSRGQIENPNAELLFKGPTIRDFGFSFSMVARSAREGEEIRQIIRQLKIAAAPARNNSSLLTTPDIFWLRYMRGNKELETVNRMTDMALSSINVNYSPGGFWNSYEDSQPIAVDMQLSFTELRPIYKEDQENTSFASDSVGY